MEQAKVAMLAYHSGAMEGDPKWGPLTDSEEFWKALEATPEDQLKPVHLELFAALKIKPPPQAK